MITRIGGEIQWMRSGLDGVGIGWSRLGLLLLDGMRMGGIPRSVSVMVSEEVAWDLISDVMKVAAVDNEAVSFPSYC